MNLAGCCIALQWVAVLAGGGPLFLMGTASAEPLAVEAVVTGTLIQKVGFRAMIQKEAIMYNLAGWARNNPDGTVLVNLQGAKDRIDQVLEAIRTGTKKSSRNNTVSDKQIARDPTLKTFTVYAWTSTSRNITNPYDLVFHLRSTDEEISRHDAKIVWNTIAMETLKGDDLAKFKNNLDDN